MPHNSKKVDGVGYGNKYAVKSVSVFGNDVVIKWAERRREREIGGDKGKRGEVAEFSEDSRRRLAFVASNTAVNFTTMITLTYPKDFPGDGKQVKAHLNRFLAWLRSRGINDYLWFLEFQKRGAPHYHLLIVGNVSQEDVSERWYKAVGSGDEKHLVAGTRVEGIRVKDGGKRYAVKYGQKMQQKVVPALYRNVGRFWGCSKSVKPEPLVVNDTPMSQGDLLELLDGWGYKKSIEKRPLSVLYNASDTVIKNIKGEENEKQSRR